MKKVISADEFMCQNIAPKRSKLAPFADDILLLKKNGYTDTQILKFLSMNGVTVAQSTLNQFIKKKRNHSNKPQSAEPIAEPVNETPLNQKVDKPNHDNHATEQPKPKPTLKKGIKKFDWKNAPTDGFV